VGVKEKVVLDVGSCKQGTPGVWVGLTIEFKLDCSLV